jgi:hypothetical protein
MRKPRYIRKHDEALMGLVIPGDTRSGGFGEPGQLLTLLAALVPSSSIRS